MRKLFVAVVAVSALIAPASAYASRCSELRLACEYKGRLGESGGGNCKTYRAVCQRQTTCGQLRYYCLHKEEFGGQGQGYCERYRESCH